MTVRELPPLRLSVLATTPNGYTFRWGADERRPEDVPSALSFSTIIPGGFETLDCELPRKMALDYADLRRLTTLTALGAGGRIAAEARLEKAPRVSGDTLSVSPQAVGHQAHLADDEGAAEIYVDRDLSRWRGMSRDRRVALLTAGTYHPHDPSVVDDTSTAIPASELAFDGEWGLTSLPLGEGVYDCGPGVTGASLYYDWNTATGTSATWTLRFVAANSDSHADVTAGDVGSDLQSGVSGTTGTHTASTPRRVLIFQVFWGTASTSAGPGVTFAFDFRRLAVFGNHGLTKQGTAPAQGYYASDVIANAVSRWAPALRFTTGSAGTIAPTTFAIPQLAFPEPTTADVIIKEADRFHLRDWAVWEGPQPNQPTFYYQDRGARGRRWRARVRPAKLEETGPQLDKLFNGVFVRYTDAAGTPFTVGPTGTLADSTSAYLIDSDPLNPANQVGIKRYTTLDMGINSTAEAATEVGRRFLEESKLHDRSGSAELVGHVEDDRGVIHPAWAVRAGDEISFTDASDASYRRIVRTSYEHDSRSNSLDLDSPPEGLDSLLERLGVAIAPGASASGAGSGAVPAQNRPTLGGGSDRPVGGGRR